MLSLSERVFRFDDAVRSVTVFDDDLNVLESKVCDLNSHNPLLRRAFDRDPRARDRKFLEVARMVSSAVGRDGRVIFHAEASAILAFRVGNSYGVVELAESENYALLERRVRSLMSRSYPL